MWTIAWTKNNLANLHSITDKYRLLAICNDCANTVELNVPELKERHGPDYPVPAIRQRLKCKRCGSSSCAVHLALYD
jgi:hypothetical protein